MNNCIGALLQLNRLSPQFPNQLTDILARREFDESVQNLETDDPLVVLIVEYLDEVLPSSH